MILKLLFIIHLTIWFIVYFGCLFNSTLNKFNLLILLPVIFIAQSLPFHPIMYTKMKYIKENFNAHNDNNLCDEEKEDMKRLSRIFNEPYDKILEYYSTYMNNEDIIGKHLRIIRKHCDDYCNKNPFSSQGLIIIGYIINVYAYFMRNT